MAAGVGTEMTQNNLPPTTMGNQESETPEQSRWSKWLGYLRYKGDWLEETRGSLMVVATVITTITFQLVLSPPGGLWQNDIKGTIPNNNDDPSTSTSTCLPGKMCRAGTMVLASYADTTMLSLLTSNTISFTASLSVTFLLISGFPLKNKVFMGILTFAMCITLTFLGITYMLAFAMIVPDELMLELDNNILVAIGVLPCLIAVVVLIHTIRFLDWLVKKIRSFSTCANALTHWKNRLGWTRL